MKIAHTRALVVHKPRAHQQHSEGFCGLQSVQGTRSQALALSLSRSNPHLEDLSPCVMSANKTHGRRKKQIGSAVYASVGSSRHLFFFLVQDCVQ